MAQAALSYQQPQRRTREQEQPQRQPQRPPLRVVPGKAPSTRTAPGLAPFWRVFFTVSVAVVLFVGALFIVRVGFADATMTLSAKSAQINRAIEEKRSEGAQLEVEYLLTSNPVTILEQAALLGMALDPQIEYIHLTIGE